ncbi:hypothetical protein LSH36_14g02033 [Paralvinella palmiformis]|uniref:SOCS box domain-containing protein n=1 Tax=Paralvinella palmiformis TaxID=53620 RepID=A0AAD9NIU8_9ANNE|nr:hypothetical protein LSH36_14g02033 [Paralvinella palmiformis]
MGNSSFPKAPLKAAITGGELSQLRCVLSELETNFARNAVTRGHCETALSASALTDSHQRNGGSYKLWLLSQPLNKKGDPALTLAIRSGQFHLIDYLLDCGVEVNTPNKDKETALDVLLKKFLPSESDILHYHFCPDIFPNAHPNDGDFVLPEEAKRLLRTGAKGPCLHMVILHLMKNEKKLREISELIPNLESDDNFRLSGLLLQAAVWFDKTDFLKDLLMKGVDPENFWKAQFIPTIVPNADYRQTVDIWERMSTETEGEYTLPSSPGEVTVDSSTSLQSLKLAFVQDWRADWFDCQNPDAQYRAGQLLTLDGATVMIKSANRSSVLDHVVNDIMQYLPPICGGPDLKRYPLMEHLMIAGYGFSVQQVLHFRLKYNLDFNPYLKYATSLKPLKHLSRLCIRSRVHPNVFHAVSKLKCLPSELQQYLLLGDIDDPQTEE